MQQCLQLEPEYREWSKDPFWYCVKTTYRFNGEIESEIMAEENLPIVIHTLEKPADAAYETAAGITYYSYFRTYPEAEFQAVQANRLSKLFGKSIDTGD